MKAIVWLAVVGVIFTAAPAAAQSTTGTISGRVVDAQGLALPGVTVTATSPNLQGTRETVTSENGDYILTLLPSGPYRVVFEIAGFQRVERSVGLAPTQVLPLQIELGVAGVTEAVQVVGRAADVLTQTSQVATNFNQTLMSTLPTQRDYRAVMLMAPAVHPTGPSGSFSVAGSMSFENLYMVNGVSVNENLRGQAQDLVIEDALQETNVATVGHLRRIRPLRRRCRQHGHQVRRQSVQRVLPRDDDQRQLARARAQAGQRSLCQRQQDRRRRADARVHGGRAGDARPSVVLYGGTPADQLDQPPAGDHQHPLYLQREVAALRGQADVSRGRQSPRPGGVHEDQSRRDQRHVQHRRRRWTWPASTTGACPRICSPSTTPASSPRRSSSRAATRSAT